MTSIPATISALAGIVSRITILGSSAPNPVSRHCQNAAALHRNPHSALVIPRSNPRSSENTSSKRSSAAWRGSSPMVCAEVLSHGSGEVSLVVALFFEFLELRIGFTLYLLVIGPGAKC